MRKKIVITVLACMLLLVGCQNGQESDTDNNASTSTGTIDVIKDRLEDVENNLDDIQNNMDEKKEGIDNVRDEIGE